MPRLQKGPRTPPGTPPSPWKPILNKVPNPFLDYELLALSATGATYRICQGSHVLIPLSSLPPLSPDSQPRVDRRPDHPPLYSPTTQNSLKKGSHPEPSTRSQRSERLPDPPNPGSPYLDLSPDNLSWFDSPVKINQRPRVGLHSAKKRRASLKRRAECPLIDTSSLLSASEKERLCGETRPLKTGSAACLPRSKSFFPYPPPFLRLPPNPTTRTSVQFLP